MTWLLLLSVIACFLLLLLMLWILLMMMRLFREAQRTNSEVALAQNQVVSKALALLASADGITYQAIQAMESQPTDDPDYLTPEVVDDGTIATHDEVDLLYERVIHGEELNAKEQALFDRAFATPD